MKLKSKTPAWDKHSGPNDFIVGVGASAGGMEAIHALFEAMPDNTGFSFVVIQHLSPDYKSLMAELLSRRTTMNVSEAENGMLVKPNCIYVIPSKNNIILHNGRLCLEEKNKSAVPNHSIDIFFESLAKEKKEKAIGIVLSGTGTDGTRGIESIKRNGGIAIVQDPLSAAFDGMPNSASRTGLADLILPPELIPGELLDFVTDSDLSQPFHNLSVKDEKDISEILMSLHERTKTDFTHYKRPTILRRLGKRISELGLHSLAEYKEYIKSNDEEPQNLYKEFLINVTSFFRDPEAFDLLRNQVIPAIFDSKKTKDTVKIWITACSSGEEAYSLGILVMEHMEKNSIKDINFKIFATDIDSEALEFASRGIYPLSIAKDLKEEELKKYFTQQESGYRVSTELRKHVVFANHDVLKDPPFNKLDFVSCRNMLIYINPQQQKKVLRKLHFSINLGGFLLLGPSENIGILKETMTEVNRKWKLYKCASKLSVKDENFLVVPLEPSLYPRLVNPKSTRQNMNELFKEILVEEYNMSGIIIDREFNVKQATGNYKRFLNFPESDFNFNLLKMLPPDLAVPIGLCARKAIKENEKVSLKHIKVHLENSTFKVNIFVKPYLASIESSQQFLFVLLEEDKREIMAMKNSAERGIIEQEHVDELEKELKETRQNLQAIIEELEATNEELQSSNEEMISTNEELQSTNEELQSLNEELHTVSTEHEERIKELIELNDDLSNYFQNSGIGQILLDGKMRIRRFSPMVKRLVNLIDADIGRSIVDITNNLSEFDLIGGIREVMETEEPLEKEIHMDNKYYLMQINSYIRKDSRSDGVVINFIDTTESLRLSSIIEGVFNSSTNGIAVKKAVRNKQGTIVDFEYITANRTAEKMFGLPHGTIAGKTMKQLFPFRDRKNIDLYAEVVNTGINARFEFYEETQQRWYETVVVKMLDGIVTTHTDITDKKEAADLITRNYEDLRSTSMKLIDANQQLERSNFDLLQFASVASHDLKEPLRKIQAFGNVLHSRIKNKLEDGEVGYLTKIINASGRMQTLIEDVLTLSKLSNSEIPYKKVNLNEILKRIAEDLEIVIREKAAELEFDELPSMEAVPGQFHQLFQNLISNSLKFNNKPNPKIKISHRKVPADLAIELLIRPEEYFCISVADNGIGFESQYKEKIFGVFQRLHGRNYEGTGIGLSIARKIVENHKGFIMAEGQLNKGATFSIILPKTLLLTADDSRTNGRDYD